MKSYFVSAIVQLGACRSDMKTCEESNRFSFSSFSFCFGCTITSGKLLGGDKLNDSKFNEVEKGDFSFLRTEKWSYFCSASQSSRKVVFS